MVTHDYERGVISGLPKSVLDHVRRTGKLPDDAMSVNLRAVWEAVAWQKAHADPPGMTVADIQRQFMGWDDAFDPVAWERMTGGKVPMPAPFGGVGAPGPGEGRSVVELLGAEHPPNTWSWLPDFWIDDVVDCTDEQRNRWNLIRRCLESGFADGEYLWQSVEDWCYQNLKPQYSWWEDKRHAIERWISSPCDCARTKWLLEPPSQWPQSVRADMEKVCSYTAGLLNSKEPAVDLDGTPHQRCAYFDWSRLDFDRMMAADGSCFFSWDGAEGGPCVKVLWFDPVGDEKCDPRASAPGLVRTIDADPADMRWVVQASCGCWTVDDFGTDCYCGAATVDCRPEDGSCRCSGSCYRDGGSCDWGPATFSTLKQDCRTV